MTTWRVLKREPSVEIDLPNGGKAWNEIGSHESETSYSLGYNASSKIGEAYGAGEYLLVSEDRSTSMRIGERIEFYEVEDEVAEPSLQAVPSAAEIMGREG